MILPDSLYESIFDYMKSQYPKEGCGVVYQKEENLLFTPCQNVAENPNMDFAIATRDFLLVKQIGVPVAIVHSHPERGAYPSEEDKKRQEISNLPWLIVSTKDFSNREIYWLDRPQVQYGLYGRPYLWHQYDCYSFIRDFYKQELSIELPDFYRKKNFWEFGDELYLDRYKHAGFYEVPKNKIEYGDVIILQIGRKVASHAGVYLGNNLIGHHMNGKLSCKDVYGQQLINRTVCVVRHKDIKCTEQ